MGESVELQQLVDDELEEEIVQFQYVYEKPPAPAPSHPHRRRLQRYFFWQRWKCPYLGLILAILSSLFFSLCAVIVKWMRDIDPIALAAYRYVGVLLPAIPIVIYKQEPIFPRGKRLVLLLRSFNGTVALMLSFYAFRHMPLADASVIVFSVPVFTAIFAHFFLKEPCGWFNVLTVITTLIGVVLITRPPLIFSHTVDGFGGDDVDDRPELWSALAAFASTLFGANAYVLLRALKGIHYSVIMTNFGSYALVQCLLVTIFLGALCLPQCGRERWLVLALAVFSFMGQILLTVALQIEQAGPVAIARSSDIVFAFGWQVMFFEERPNLYSIMGAVLVMSSVVVIGVRKWILALPETSSVRRRLYVLTK